MKLNLDPNKFDITFINNNKLDYRKQNLSVELKHETLLYDSLDKKSREKLGNKTDFKKIIGKLRIIDDDQRGSYSKTSLGLDD